MSTPSILRSLRSRAASAGALVLALSLVSAPAVLAQEGPEQALDDLMAALEAKDVGNLAGFFCDEYASQADDFDVSGLAAALGVDPGLILDAIVLDADVTSLEVVSQTDTEATVRLVGTLTTGVDAEKLAPLAETLLTARGQEVTPEMVEELIGTLTADAEATTLDISDDVTMTSDGAGGWVICDVLGGASASPEASMAALESAPAAEPTLAAEG